MMEYSDEPAYSHSPCSSSYSILCKQTFGLPPEGLSLLPGKGPTLCTHTQKWLSTAFRSAFVGTKLDGTVFCIL